jgi:hypothetical protein
MDNVLYSFDPAAKRFTRIGTLDCNVPYGMTPNSMAIDRTATAWVNYVEQDGSGRDVAGSLYAVRTSDASCTGASMTLPRGWMHIGMGYATNSATTTDETLYVAGISSAFGAGPGLARVDLSARTVVPIGAFSAPLTGQSAELTGTGDGRLFGFFTRAPVSVAPIDGATGATTTPDVLPNVEPPDAWAFSFWGSQFFLYDYNRADPLPSSTVWKVDPTTGAATEYMSPSELGFVIVGAGVSTCAPTTSTLR